jgi:chromosome segregation ATPase
MAPSISAGNDERLTQINRELSSILEEKMEFLNRTLSETQKLSQKIASAELEAQRHQEQQHRLEEESLRLQRDIETYDRKVKEASAQRDSRQEESHSKEKEIQRLEWEISDKRKSISAVEDRTRDLEAELSTLERTSEDMGKDVERKEAKIVRLQKIRDEFMSRIAELDREEDALNSLNTGR